MSGDMNGYIEAGMLVIKLTASASMWAVIAVTFACLKGFITDTIPSMPRHLSSILTMREYGYGGSRLQGIRDPIGWFALFQTVGIGLGVTLGSMLVWPLYILLAVLYTIRAAYRGRESIMEFFRAMMNYRPERPSDSFIEKQVEVERIVLADQWEAVQETQEGCTCKGAPHDDDCAVVRDFVNVPPIYNKDNVPRWAQEPPDTKPHKSPAYTAPYKDGKMIHDKESS